MDARLRRSHPQSHSPHAMTVPSLARLAALPLLLAALSPLGGAQEIGLPTTLSGGTTTEGNMFEITAFRDLTVTRLDAHLEVGVLDVELYYAAGGFTGIEGTPAAWTLAGTANVVGQGFGNLTPIPIQLDVDLMGGETYAFYLTNKGGQNPRLITTEGTGQIFTNGDMAITQGFGVDDHFGQTEFPRLFNGTVYYEAPGLTTDTDTISIASGGKQVMRLTSGVNFGNLPYLVLGSATGTSPGLPLDGFTLPLVLDGYTDYTLLAPNTAPLKNTFGNLDAQGFAQAEFEIPSGLSANFVGIQLHHAYIVLELTPTLLAVVDVSDAASVTFVP